MFYPLPHRLTSVSVPRSAPLPVLHLPPATVFTPSASAASHETDNSSLVHQQADCDSDEPGIQIATHCGYHSGHEEDFCAEDLSADQSSDHMEKEGSSVTDMNQVAAAVDTPTVSTFGPMPASTSETPDVTSVAKQAKGDHTELRLKYGASLTSGTVATVCPPAQSVCDVRSETVSMGSAVNVRSETQSVGSVPVSDVRSETQSVGSVPVSDVRSETMSVGYVPVSDVRSETMSVGSVPVSDVRSETVSVGSVPVSDVRSETVSVGFVPMSDVRSETVSVGSVPVSDVRSETVSVGFVPMSDVRSETMSVGSVPVSDVRSETVSVGSVPMSDVRSETMLVGSAGNVRSETVSVGSVPVSDVRSETMSVGSVSVSDVRSETVSVGSVPVSDVRSETMLVGSAGNVRSETVSVGSVPVIDVRSKTFQQLSLSQRPQNSTSLASSTHFMLQQRIMMNQVQAGMRTQQTGLAFLSPSAQNAQPNSTARGQSSVSRIQPNQILQSGIVRTTVPAHQIRYLQGNGSKSLLHIPPLRVPRIVSNENQNTHVFLVQPRHPTGNQNRPAFQVQQRQTMENQNKMVLLQQEPPVGRRVPHTLPLCLPISSASTPMFTLLTPQPSCTGIQPVRSSLALSPSSIHLPRTIRSDQLSYLFSPSRMLFTQASGHGVNSTTPSASADILQYNSTQAGFPAQQNTYSQRSSSNSSGLLPVFMAQHRVSLENQSKPVLRVPLGSTVESQNKAVGEVQQRQTVGNKYRTVISQPHPLPEVKRPPNTVPTYPLASLPSPCVPIAPRSSLAYIQPAGSHFFIPPSSSSHLVCKTSNQSSNQLHSPATYLPQVSGSGESTIVAVTSAETSLSSGGVAASVELGSTTGSVSNVASGTTCLPDSTDRNQPGETLSVSLLGTQAPGVSADLHPQQNEDRINCFVKCHKTYECLMCSKRMKDKDELYAHVWAHLHPEEKQCDVFCDVSTKQCTLAKAAAESVSLLVDRAIPAQLNNDTVENFTRRSITDGTESHLATGASCGDMSDQVLPTTRSEPGKSGGRMDCQETPNTAGHHEPLHETTLTDTTGRNGGLSHVESSSARVKEQAGCSESPESVSQHVDTKSCTSTEKHPACSKADSCPVTFSGDVQAQHNADDHDTTLATGKAGAETHGLEGEESTIAADTPEPIHHDSAEDAAVQDLVVQKRTSDSTTDLQGALSPPEVDRKGAFFVCTLCKFSCDTAIDFTMHLTSIHYDEEEFPCYHCNYRGQYSTDLTDHLSVHATGDRNMYMCPCRVDSCDFKTDGLKNLCKHISSHQDMALYRCHKCKSDFDSEGDFLIHVALNSMTLFTCGRCPSHFIDEGVIQQHSQAKHSGEWQYRVSNVLLCCERRINNDIFAERESHTVRQSVDKPSTADDSLRPDIEDGSNQTPAVADMSSSVNGVPCSDALCPVSDTSGQTVEGSDALKSPHSCLPEKPVPAAEAWHSVSGDPSLLVDQGEPTEVGGVDVSKDENQLPGMTDLHHASLTGIPDLEMTEVSNQHPCGEVCRAEDILPQLDIERESPDAILGFIDGGGAWGSTTSLQSGQVHSKITEGHQMEDTDYNSTEKASCSKSSSVHNPVDSSGRLEGDDQTADHHLLPKKMNPFAEAPTEKTTEPPLGYVKLTDLFGSSELHRKLFECLYSEEHSQFRCSICDQRFDKLHNIHQHLFVECRVPLLSCVLCEFRCYLKSDYKIHFKENHPGKQRSCNCLLVNRRQFFYWLNQLSTIQNFKEICRDLIAENEQSNQTTPGAMSETSSDQHVPGIAIDTLCMIDDASATIDNPMTDEAADLPMNRSRSSSPPVAEEDGALMPEEGIVPLDSGQRTVVIDLTELRDDDVQVTASNAAPLAADGSPLAADVVTVDEGDDIQGTERNTCPANVGGIKEAVMVIEDDYSNGNLSLHTETNCAPACAKDAGNDSVAFWEDASLVADVSTKDAQQLKKYIKEAVMVMEDDDSNGSLSPHSKTNCTPASTFLGDSSLAANVTTKDAQELEKDSSSSGYHAQGVCSSNTSTFNSVKQQDACSDACSSSSKQLESARQTESECLEQNSSSSTEKPKPIKRKQAEHSEITNRNSSSSKKFKGSKQAKAEQVSLECGSSSENSNSSKQEDRHSGSKDSSMKQSKNKRKAEYTGTHDSSSLKKFKNIKQNGDECYGPNGNSIHKSPNSRQQEQRQPEDKRSGNSPSTHITDRHTMAQGSTPSESSISHNCGHTDEGHTASDISPATPCFITQQVYTEEQSFGGDRQHRASAHRKWTNRFECKLCSQKQPDEQSMKAHLRRHLVLVAPHCHTCSLQFLVEEEAQDHHKHEHQGQPFVWPAQHPDTESKLKQLLRDSVHEEEDDDIAAAHEEEAGREMESTDPMPHTGSC